MLTKSIKLTRKDAIGLADIVKRDPRVERGASEALRICYEDAAMNLPNWKEITEKAEALDYTGEDADASRESTTISFLVDEKTFMTVLESIRTQLGCLRPRVSYITRLCIYAGRLKLYPDKEAALPLSDPVDSTIHTARCDLSLEDFKSLAGINEKLDAIYAKLLEFENRRIS